jgi:hypothetical protein
MDEQTISLIERAVHEGLTSSSWIILVIIIVGAGIAAFLGSYLAKKGEQHAIKENFDDVLRQVHAQTKTTEEVKREIAKELAHFTQRLERRSEFEQYLLMERYKLISEFAYRLSRITTDLNRVRHGQDVEGLFKDNEVVPLTAVFEDLAIRSFQLSEKFHKFFFEQAGVVLQMAQTSTDEELARIKQKYTTNLQRLTKMVNAEFGTEKISW